MINEAHKVLINVRWLNGNFTLVLKTKHNKTMFSIVMIIPGPILTYQLLNSDYEY